MERVQVIGQGKAEAHLEESWMKTEFAEAEAPRDPAVGARTLGGLQLS